MKIYGVDNKYGLQAPVLEVFEVVLSTKRQIRLNTCGRSTGYRTYISKDDLGLLGFTEAEAWSKYRKKLYDKIEIHKQQIEALNNQLAMIPVAYR